MKLSLWLICGVGIASLPACDNAKPTPAPDGQTATATSTAAASTTAAANASAVTTPTGTASSQPPAMAAASTTATAEAAPAEAAADELPSLALFGSAKDLLVTGSSQLACEVKEVKGWVRVICRGKTLKGEAIQEIIVQEGRVKGKTTTKVDAGLQGQLLTPLPAGTRLRALFKWQGREHTLTIDRSSNAQPSPFGEFSDFEALPNRQQFDAGSEVGVRGSTALGCSTRYAGGWFRIECGTNNRVGGPPQAVTVLSGEKSSTKIVAVPNKILQITTPFEAGDSLVAQFNWKDAEHKLRLEWPAGYTQPSHFGAFDGMNSMPEAAEFDAVGEVTVTGSSALKCSTKYIPGWFRAVCIGNNDTGGTTDKIKIVEGVEAKDSALYAAKGIMSITAKVIAGSKLRADFVWSDKTMQLQLDWPEKTPQPKTFGAFKPAKP